MSWSEIKKAINSDLSEPLNYLAWINDLATFGESGYVAFDAPKLSELASKSQNALKHKIARNYLLEGVIQSGEDVGAYFELITEDATGSFDGLTTMELVAEDATATTAIANNETAMKAVSNSETAMTVIANSEIAMTIVANSEIAMTIVANSIVALPSLFASFFTRGVLFDSVIASDILMNSDNLSRQWMIDNVAITSQGPPLRAALDSPLWSPVLRAKALGLRLRITDSSQATSAYWKNPENSPGITSTSFVDFNHKLTDFTLGVITAYSGWSGGSAKIPEAIWVPMSEL